MSSVKPIVLILDNIRSALNVGAILRSADVFGVSEVWCCGITPYPLLTDDQRLPYIVSKATKMIAKTALGAETTIKTLHFATTAEAIRAARAKKYHIYALEQDKKSISLSALEPNYPLALVLGNENRGVSLDTLNMVDSIVEIPQFGHKESLNVSVAAGIALYALAH